MSVDVLDTRGLSLERLRSFLEVADAEGMIARAAPGQPTKQSQLSRQIGELAEAFGVELLERRGRRAVLTDAGRRLAAVVREAFQGLRDVSANEDAPMPFTLGAGDSLLHWWVIPRIGRVTARVPRAIPTIVSVSSRDVGERLLDARLDFGLMRAGDVPKGLASHPIGTIEYALYVPRKLRVASLPLEAILERAPIALQGSEDTLNAPLRAWMKKAGVRVALECETFPQACRAAQSGCYAALLPTIARGDLGNCEEVVVPGVGRVKAKVVLAWHARATRTRRNGALLARALGEELSLSL